MIVTSLRCLFIISGKAFYHQKSGRTTFLLTFIKRINPNITYFKKLKLHTVKLYSKDQSCQKLKTQDSKHVWSKDYQGKSELAFIDQ